MKYMPHVWLFISCQSPLLYGMYLKHTPLPRKETRTISVDKMGPLHPVLLTEVKATISIVPEPCIEMYYTQEGIAYVDFHTVDDYGLRWKLSYDAQSIKRFLESVKTDNTKELTMVQKHQFLGIRTFFISKPQNSPALLIQEKYNQEEQKFIAQPRYDLTIEKELLALHVLKETDEKTITHGPLGLGKKILLYNSYPQISLILPFTKAT